MTATEMLLLVLALLVLACILLLVAVLAGQSRDRSRMRELKDELLDEVDACEEGNGELLRRSLDDMSASLQRQGQGQTTVLESMQRQILLSTRNQEERFSQMTTTLEQGLARDAQSMEQLRASNERQLTEMRQVVDEKLSDTLDRRLNESFAQVSRQLEQVYKGLGEMQTIASGVGDLKKVLTNVKSRGIWGEMQLGSLLEAVLAPGQYAENVEIVPGSGERVEFAIRLPGQGEAPVWLPIDSKFPQEDYLRMNAAAQAGNKAEEAAARQAFLRQIRTEAQRISGKYIHPPYSTDFAVLFLPVEGLYAEVIRETDTVSSLQASQRVILAGPSTFAALLNSLQMGFRTLAIQQRSAEIWQLLGTVRTDFTRFGEALEKTRRQMNQASETLDAAFTRSRQIQRRLSALENDLPGLPQGEDTEQTEEDRP